MSNKASNMGPMSPLRDLLNSYRDAARTERDKGTYFERLKDRIGAEFGLYIHPRFDDFEEVRVFAIDCLPARSTVFVRAENEQRFYVRNGPTTVQLSGAQAQEYMKQRFS